MDAVTFHNCRLVCVRIFDVYSQGYITIDNARRYASPIPVGEETLRSRHKNFGTCPVLFCFFYFGPCPWPRAASVAIIELRSSWPLGPRKYVGEARTSSCAMYWEVCWLPVLSIVSCARFIATPHNTVSDTPMLVAVSLLSPPLIQMGN